MAPGGAAGDVGTTSQGVPLTGDKPVSVLVPLWARWRDEVVQPPRAGSGGAEMLAASGRKGNETGKMILRGLVRVQRSIAVMAHG